MNALGIHSQDGDRLTAMDFRWSVPQVRAFFFSDFCGPSFVRLLLAEAREVTKFCAQEKYQLMLQDWLKLPPGERKPVHLKDNISMVVYDSSSGLLFVAYTLENMQPLQIIEALKAITMCLHSAFGGLSEEKACYLCCII